MTTTTRTAVPVLRDRDDQPAVQYLGAHVRTALRGADTAGALAVLEHAAPRGYHAPMYRNTRADETILIRDGTVLVRVGDTDRLLSAGSVAHVPLGTAHGFVVVSDRAHLTTLHAPAGFEVFHEAVGAPAPTPQDGPAAPVVDAAAPSVAEIAETAARHGLVVVGPPPPIPTGC